MSPQLPGFNRGIWKKLEELVRDWAVEYEGLYIVTGPVLKPGLPNIGPNQVSVPAYYYKVILDYTEPDLKGIGFILPNASSGDPLQNFSVTIDSIERFTGIDFFPLLPDNREKLLESSRCLKCWSWPESGDSKGKSDEGSSGSRQCNGMTKSGERCKNHTTNPEGYCYIHVSQASGKSEKNMASSRRSVSVQCSGTTKAGNRCKHMTYSPNGRCYQHGGD
jgi:endonuclease G